MGSAYNKTLILLIPAIEGCAKLSSLKAARSLGRISGINCCRRRRQERK